MIKKRINDHKKELITKINLNVKYKKTKLLIKTRTSSTRMDKIIEELKKEKLIKEQIKTETKGFKKKYYRKIYELTEKGYQEQIKIKNQANA